MASFVHHINTMPDDTPRKNAFSSRHTYPGKKTIDWVLAGGGGHISPHIRSVGTYTTCTTILTWTLNNSAFGAPLWQDCNPIDKTLEEGQAPSTSILCSYCSFCNIVVKLYLGRFAVMYHEGLCIKNTKEVELNTVLVIFDRGNVWILSPCSVIIRFV